MFTRSRNGAARAARAMLFGAAFAITVPAAPVQTANAQTYPDKPIRLVLPYNPGGIIDFVGRTIAQRLGDAIGQPVVAENRPGAGGMVGTSTVARAPADGYTLLLMDPAIVINPSLQKDVPYNLFKDLRPVSIVGSSPLMMVVTPKIGATTVAQFMDYAKKNKGKLNFASAGVGTTPHLAGELFNIRTGIEATHVPYRGSGPAVPDLMAGKIHLAFNSYVVSAPFLSDRRLLVLGAAGPKRVAAAPDVPTMAEAGIPDFEVNLWVGVFAPIGVPDAVVTRLNAALKEALASPELQKSFAKVGVEPDGSSVKDSEALVRSEFKKWADVITQAKIKPE